MYVENPKQFDKTFRIQIAHTEQEIDTIIWMGVFCGDKTGFVRPGHICRNNTSWTPSKTSEGKYVGLQLYG